MSVTNSTEIECPECKSRQKVEYWDSINVTTNPELRDKLFQAKLNRFVCSECQYEAFLNVPLLYNDMEKRFCAHFFPRDILDQQEFYEHFTVEGRHPEENFPKEALDAVPYLLSPHLVFSMDELLCYVIFRERLWEKKQGQGEE
ncbi:MAG: CpXC domain-containing protein [Desulfatibacillaceae bacterium]